MNWLTIVCILSLISFFATVAWAVAQSVGTWARPVVALAFLLSIPVSWLLFTINMGWASPVIPYLNEPPQGKQMQIEWIRMLPGDAIYILMNDNEGELRYWRLKWNGKYARQIQDHLNKGGKLGNLAFEWTTHGELNLHEVPQLPDPEPKPDPEQAPIFLPDTQRR